VLYNHWLFQSIRRCKITDLETHEVFRCFRNIR